MIEESRAVFKKVRNQQLEEKDEDHRKRKKNVKQYK